MKALSPILTLAAFTIATNSLAGVRVSGGGHQVVCNSGSPTASYELLDLYEARHVFSYRLDLPSDGNFSNPNQRVLEKVDIMLERLKSLSPLRYEWYRSEAQVFFDQLSLFTSDELRFMNDSYYEVLGENCSLEQVALQQERGFIGDPTFFVNLPRWNRFDLNSRAALIVHEIIYNEFLLYGHTDSVSARRMVAFLASNYFRHHYLKNFLVDLHSAKIPDTDIGGIWVRLWDFATDEDPLRSKKLKPADENLIQSVLAEAYPNFEPSNYSLPNLFVQMRTYNPFYVVNNSHIRVLAERSQQLLPIEITFNHDQKISSLRTREPTNGPATLWLQHADQSWQQVHELSWDDAGILTLAR